MKYITHWATALITLCALLYVHLNSNYVTELARLKQFDVLQQTDPVHISSDVAVVEIDEATIAKYGQWPFKRDIIAQFIWQLREAGAGVIVLPILFAEPDRLGGDMALVEALKDNGVVIAQVGTTQANRNAVPRGVAKIGNPMDWLFDWPGMLGPINILGQSADGVGVINTFPEIDGVTRRIPLIVKDSFPQLKVLSVANMLGEAIWRIHEESSVSSMFR